MNKREYFFKNQILTDGLEDFIVTEAHENFLMIKMIGNKKKPTRCSIINGKVSWGERLLIKAGYTLKKDGIFLKQIMDS